MLSWDDFRYVRAIANARSLNGAAQSLSVNHSTIFRRLGQIEQQLGSRLFERGRAGYALTPAGEEMVRLAERISEDVTTFERKVTGQDLRPSGELRITTNDMVLLHILTGVLVDFREAYPEILLDIVVSNAMLNLSRRDADVAVRATSMAPETLTGRRVAKIAWAVFGPATHSIKHFDPYTDAPNHQWVGFSDHIAIPKASRWLKDRAGSGDRLVYKINTMLGLAEAVAAGAGLGLLPCFVGQSIEGLARLTPPLPEMEGGLWLVTHPDLRNAARVRAFVDFCEAEIGKRRNMLECVQ